ncbi:hypothetical protein HYR99_01975 [Candidatus Poribacteria bacterium]|nr:hypothetical protein [Candidatus Poribacteria bacterium]
MCQKEVDKLIDYLYGKNKPPHEPKYKRRQEMIEKACSIYGDYGDSLHKELLQLLNGYAIENQTDWNYDSCFSFLALLHPGVPYDVRDKASAIELVQRFGGTAYFLTLQISALGPYYTYRFCRRTYSHSTDRLIDQTRECPFSADQEETLKKVVRYCERQGFKRLNREFLDQIVPGIALDIAEEGEVTVYNCLFVDT